MDEIVTIQDKLRVLLDKHAAQQAQEAASKEELQDKGGWQVWTNC